MEGSKLGTHLCSFLEEKNPFLFVVRTSKFMMEIITTSCWAFIDLRFVIKLRFGINLKFNMNFCPKLHMLGCLFSLYGSLFFYF